MPPADLYSGVKVIRTQALSDEEALQVAIPRGQNFFRRTLPINFSIAQNNEARRSPGDVIGILALIKRHNALGLRVKPEICQCKSVLQTVRGEQRRYAVDIAQPQQQSDYGLRSYRVESGRGRII